MPEKKSLGKRIASTQIWRSIFRHGPPNNVRNRALTVISNFFLHLHPITMPKHALRLRYTWCMGGIAFFLFLVETVTGVLLMFYYRPTPEYAYMDVQALRDEVTMGILREVHRWGAHAMVAVVWLHMLRVFMTGSYKPPREFNWVLGVWLLVFTLLLSFTGYLLPWDQLAMWAITVGTNMASAAPLAGASAPFSSTLHIGNFQILTPSNDVRFVLLGGKVVGGAALLRFYVLHCVAIPLIAVIFMCVHIWRVRKDGGISRPL